MAGQTLFRLKTWISPWKTDTTTNTEYVHDAASVPHACGGLAPVVQIHDQLQDDIQIILAQNGQPVESWLTVTVGEIKAWLREKAECAAAPPWDVVEAHVRAAWAATDPGDAAAPGLGMVLQGLKMLRETAPVPSVTAPVTPVVDADEPHDPVDQF